MKLRVIFTFIGLAYSCVVYADTTSLYPIPSHIETGMSTKLNISEKVKYNTSLTYNFLTAGNTNPAVKKLIPIYSITQISAGWELNKQSEALIMQLGDGSQSYTISTQSHINKQKYTVWGKAHYKKGERKNVQWNESSDYHIVYPYVIADTIGGNLDHEEYFFSGGYACNFNKLTWGIYADYRASLEYRTIDPRPRNTVGDLSINTGLMYNIRNSHHIGASLSYRKYKQAGEVEFFSPEGKNRLMHFTGMGMLYMGQGNGEPNYHYNGKAFGATIDFIPHNNSGFAGAVSFNSFSFNKIINAFNDFPLNYLKENTLYAEISYFKDFKYGAKLQFTHKNRKGTERLPGDPQNGIYPILVTAQQYNNPYTNIVLTLLYNNKTPFASNFNKIGWSVQPQIGYTKVEFKYKNPLSKMEISSLNAGFTIEINKAILHHSGLLKVGFDFMHNQNTNSSITLNNNATNSINAMVMNNFNTFASSFQQYGTSLRYNYNLKTSLIYLKSQWTYSNYSHKLTNRFLQVSLGYQF